MPFWIPPGTPVTLPLSHTNPAQISAVGVNTHAQIDTALVTANAHYADAIIHVNHSAVVLSGATSIAGGGDITASRTFTLVNDVLAPGNSFYYGTSGAGVKGFFALPPAALAITEKDFGATPVYEAIFSVVDALVTAGMRINAGLAYEAPTGRDLDETELVDFNVVAGQAIAGSFSMLVQSRCGLVAGLYKFVYTRG